MSNNTPTFGGNIEATFFPKTNADGSDDSLHDGTCSKTIGGCDCDPSGCRFDFSLKIEILNTAGKNVPTGESLRWGLTDPTTPGKNGDSGIFDQNAAGLWNAVYESGPLTRSLACGNPDSAMDLVVGTDSQVWATLKIHLHCPDCPNNLPPNQQ